MASKDTSVQVLATHGTRRDDQFDLILGRDVVRSLERAVQDAFIASQMRAHVGGEAALDTLLVMMLATIIGAPERIDDCNDRTAAANDLLLELVGEFQNRYGRRSPAQLGSSPIRPS